MACQYRPEPWRVDRPRTVYEAARRQSCRRLRHLRQIRRRVGREVTTRLVLELVLSRLDYCNSLLAGLPASSQHPSKSLKCRCSPHL